MDGLWTERQREEKTAHVWPYEPLCALFRQRAAAICTPDGLSLVSGICGGRKKKQDKGQASKPPLCPVTTARSAGSYGDFYVAVKWGQKQQAGITFAVTFPECLEAWTKSRGHAGDTYSFLLLCHTVSAGAPPQKLRLRYQRQRFKQGSTVVTLLKISARSPGSDWEVVIGFAVELEAARRSRTGRP